MKVLTDQQLDLIARESGVLPPETPDSDLFSIHVARFKVLKVMLGYVSLLKERDDATR